MTQCSYFTAGAPQLGSPEFTAQHDGNIYHFANARNLEIFNSSPDKYAPKYDGYCAFGASRGYKAEIDPNAWHIVGNRLYLNYSRSVQTRWKKDIPGNISKADAHWKNLSATN
ncbi:hypothetical protein JM93_00913 [Roseibium hamelinense]|uniref:YHS domain-containing protein n=1 Tax=Roseibium hamelinense TaxID=150831 RepID=A0A562TI65_9HYPH|nr:YHS domain-containing (seleno)protein [Roseibium hamelinense]MTI42611.1 tat pathway signal sequence domain protein [Roseibium hamelinense]TWI93357.1 hypothetical protein JM93_00913 [Roseibium hamelinense]